MEYLLFPVHLSSHWVLVVSSEIVCNNINHHGYYIKMIGMDDQIIYYIDHLHNESPTTVNWIWYITTNLYTIILL